jgi:hypothetical protein
MSENDYNIVLRLEKLEKEIQEIKTDVYKIKIQLHKINKTLDLVPFMF